MKKEIEFAAGVSMDATGLFNWIKRATPFLKSQLWTCSDALATPPKEDGISDILQESLERDHKELTDLLRQVGALEE